MRDASICIWDYTTHVMWQVQEHGYYQLKFKYWKEFDPLFAHFYPNELEDAQVCRFIIFPHFLDFMMGCWMENVITYPKIVGRNKNLTRKVVHLCWCGNTSWWNVITLLVIGKSYTCWKAATLLATKFTY